MNLSFQEKSLWGVLVGMIVVYGGYFALVLPTRATSIAPEHVVLFVLAIVALVATQVIWQSVVAIIDRRSATDERDRLIALKGTRNASYVLASGVFFALCAAVFTPGNFVFTHLLLGAWVLAQLVEISSQLVLYRRGA